MRKICLLTLIFTFILQINVFASNAQNIAEDISSFKKNITITSSNYQSALKSACEFDPRIIVYFNGYSVQDFKFFSKINFNYTNTEIPISQIYVANTKEDIIDILTRAFLYNKNTIHIVANNSLNFDNKSNMENFINHISENEPIAIMGYDSINLSVLDPQIINYKYYKLDIKYTIDNKTLLNYKKELEKKAMNIVAGNIAKNMPDYMKVFAIHNYIVDNCTYAKDYEINQNPLYYTPYGALVNGRAVCDGYASATKLLLNLCEIENIKVVGNSKGVGHAWNLVKLGNDFYNLDTTWDDPVTTDNSNVKRYDYYNITDEKLSKDHTWNKEKYPSANGTYFNYENTKNLILNDTSNYTEAYTSFESVFLKYPDLSSASNQNNNITLDNPDLNANTYTNDEIKNNFLSFMVYHINENKNLYIKFCIILFVLLILKNLFKKK